jgi:hypothetical protein
MTADSVWMALRDNVFRQMCGPLPATTTAPAKALTAARDDSVPSSGDLWHSFGADDDVRK